MKKIYSKPTMEVVEIGMTQILAASSNTDIRMTDPGMEDILFGGSDIFGNLNPS